MQGVLLWLKAIAPVLIKEHSIYYEMCKFYIEGVHSETLKEWGRNAIKYAMYLNESKAVFIHQLQQQGTSVNTNNIDSFQDRYEVFQEEYLRRKGVHISGNTKIFLHSAISYDTSYDWWFHKDLLNEETASHLLITLKTAPETTMALDAKTKIVQIVSSNGEINNVLKEVQKTVEKNASSDYTGVRSEIIRKKKEVILELNTRNIIILGAGVAVLAVGGVLLKKYGT